MKRPLKQYRPFGPFIQQNRDELIKNIAVLVSGGVEDAESLPVVSIEESGCENYNNLESTIEFFASVDDVEILFGLKQPGITVWDIGDSMRDVPLQENEMLGVHNTPPEDGERILETGFRDLNVRTVKAESIRDGAVYMNGYVWDFDEYPVRQRRKGMSIVCRVKKQSVYVADMSTSALVPTEEYLSDYVMRYPEYIRCLQKLGPNGPDMIAGGLMTERGLESKPFTDELKDGTQIRLTYKEMLEQSNLEPEDEDTDIQY